MIAVGDWTLYCPRRHRSCRIAELDTLNKSLFNADFWVNITSGHKILGSLEGIFFLKLSVNDLSMLETEKKEKSNERYFYLSIVEGIIKHCKSLEN